MFLPSPLRLTEPISIISLRSSRASRVSRLSSYCCLFPLNLKVGLFSFFSLSPCPFRLQSAESWITSSNRWSLASAISDTALTMTARKTFLVLSCTTHNIGLTTVNNDSKAVNLYIPWEFPECHQGIPDPIRILVDNENKFDSFLLHYVHPKITLFIFYVPRYPIIT